MVWRRLRGNKFGNQRTVVDGISFASKAEAKRYGELRALQAAGVIFGLSLQQRFPLTTLQPGATVVERIGDYIADFTYSRSADDTLVVEDVKGMRTAVYNWKARHFAIEYGFAITEIGGRPRRKRKAKNAGTSPATSVTRQPKGARS